MTANEELRNEVVGRTIKGSCPECGQEVESVFGKKQEIECPGCGETLILTVDTGGVFGPIQV